MKRQCSRKKTSRMPILEMVHPSSVCIHMLCFNGGFVDLNMRKYLSLFDESIIYDGSYNLHRVF